MKKAQNSGLAGAVGKLDAHHKLYISLAVAAAAFGLSFSQASGATAFMITWLAYSLTSISLSWITILRSHPADVKVEAPLQDSNRTLVFLFALVTALVSFAAIFILFRSNLAGKIELLPTVMSVACILCSWWYVHTVFTMRYAHLYYSASPERRGGKISPGGLEFPGNEDPDYLDFVYFSFVIGMTFQVSDVEVSSKSIRRLVWMHGLLSFAFNTIIVAFTINLVSALIQK